MMFWQCPGLCSHPATTSSAEGEDHRQCFHPPACPDSLLARTRSAGECPLPIHVFEVIVLRHIHRMLGGSAAQTSPTIAAAGPVQMSAHHSARPGRGLR